MSIKDGGSAFPDQGRRINSNGVWADDWSPGMNLRDWFASMAMSGFLTRGDTLMRPYTDVSHDAYKMADAMLAAREAQA